MIPLPVDAGDERLEQVTSAGLTDARGWHFDHEHLPELVTPTPDRTVFGPAATVRFVPAREDLTGEEHGWARRSTRPSARTPQGRCSFAARRDGST